MNINNVFESITLTAWGIVLPKWQMPRIAITDFHSHIYEKE